MLARSACVASMVLLALLAAGCGEEQRSSQETEAAAAAAKKRAKKEGAKKGDSETETEDGAATTKALAKSSARMTIGKTTCEVALTDANVNFGVAGDGERWFLQVTFDASCERGSFLELEGETARPYPQKGKVGDLPGVGVFGAMGSDLTAEPASIEIETGPVSGERAPVKGRARVVDASGSAEDLAFEVNL